MVSKLLCGVLGTTLMSTTVLAGLPEALSFYEGGQYDKALPEFTYLADEGNPTALYYMGKLYENGLGVDADATRATEYYRRADQAGSPEAVAALAKLVFHNESIENHTNIGLEYLKRAAYNGSDEALFELGEIYRTGDGIEKEYNYAFGYYLMSALKGNKKAQHRLAFAYLEGRGTTQNFSNGVAWLSRSANQGYVQAQKDLADLLSSDPRLNNLPDAYAWYSIIAAYNTDEIGNEAAARRDEIARSIKKGKSVNERQKTAQSWHPITPAQSVPKEVLATTPTPIIPGFNDGDTVQQRLSQGDVLLTNGAQYGVTNEMISLAQQKNDLAPITEQVEKAMKTGDTTAYAYYGDLLHSRFHDDKAAFEWYKKGAELNDNYAKYQLANLYCEGRGVEAPSIAECYKWLLLASETEDEALRGTVRQALDTVEASATAEELDAGKAAVESAKAQIKETKSKKKKSSGGFHFF